ncbi:MAG: DUF1080 domain-containing protein [Sedimentisphaerales bacterium]|nr:DUF1080 domain-containing protein [Sedimentisphaerales bacterium]
MSKRNLMPVLNGVSRRNLLKTILFTPPILMFTEGGLFADQEIQPVFQPKLIPQGQKIRVAQIGVFNRGNEILGSFRQFSDKQIVYKAFADVAFTAPNQTLNGFPDVPCFRDYREMFEQMHDQIDAVIVCTPDHAHFAPVIHAMLLGKHVYVEKPMAQNVYECRLLEKVARATKVVTQMGNQGHSGAGTIQFGQWVDAGLVKNVTKIDAWMANSRRWHGWTDKTYPEEIPPIGYDWDQWLGRRPFRPYSEKLINGNWRCWFEFGCGAMGDWGAHILDAVHRYLKLGQPYEISTTLKGPSDLIYPQGSVITFRFKARDGMPPVDLRWFDGLGNVPDAPAEITGKLSGVGSLIYTQDYIIRGASHGADYKILPDAKMTGLQNAGKLPKPEGKLSNHYQNFLNACQGIEPVNSPFEVSGPLAEMLCLGCIGQRFGGTLKYDADAMEITNHPEANKMLRGPQVRAGWDAYDQQQLVKSKKSQIKKPDDVQWENLVQDKTLSNWENPYEWGEAKVVDGEVHLTSDKGKWFLLTKKEYANFVFEGEIKMPVKEGNSGFMFRCLKAKNRAWGYQAEVDTADRKWSGGLYDEGRRVWFISPNRDKAASEAEKNESIAAFRARAGECYKQGEWNLYRIVCVGSHIQIFVNGTLTTDIHDEMDLAGPIAIQHHGEKGLTYKFRNLRIKDLGAGGEVYYPHREGAKAAAVASKMEGSIYEAEAAKMVNCQIATNQAGYQGKGFADFGDRDSSLEWDNVLADNDGRYTLTFRYASGGNRPCDLYINSSKVGRIEFASTEKWTNWKTVDTTVTFKKGGNSVKLVAIGAGPNLDAMAVK